MITLDLHYLEIFYEVAKAKSFTKAAEKLYINQSAVSIQVKKFEDILKVKLFDRSSKKIKLTYIGETLYKMAEDIFEKVKRAEIEIDRARIAVGASSIIAEPLLPTLMKDFSATHQEIEYNLTISNKNHLLKLLKEGELDIIIIDSEHITDPNLEIISIEKGPYVFVSSKQYANIEEAETAPLITRSTIPNNTKAIEVIEDKYGINFDTKIDVSGNLEVIKGMVREGIGNVILPYYAVSKEIKKGEFKVISKIDEVKDGYEIIITKDKKDLSQINKFIAIIKNHKIAMESRKY